MANLAADVHNEPGKRGRKSSENSPLGKHSKKKKEGNPCICPICIEVIEEKSDKNEGHDAIFYEGKCESWLHRQCAGLSKPVFIYFRDSDISFHCPHCRLLYYDSQFSDLKSTVTQLQNKVTELKTKLSNFKSNDSINSASAVANDNADTVHSDTTSSSTSSPAPSKEHANQLTAMVTSFISEEKEKAKRRLNLIVHNIVKSTSEDGTTRKKHDVESVSGILQQYLGISATISKAYRLGQRGEKPRLLKITVVSEVEKAKILRNSTKLHASHNPLHIQKVFITPDLTPKEQEANKKLRAELKERNKNGNHYQIKNGKIVQRKI